MKRWIHCNTDETVDEAWDRYEELYSSKAYRVSGGYSDFQFTDDPETAIRYWFKLSNKYPMDAAIMCRSRKDALNLVKLVSDDPDIIYRLNEKWRSPYKLEYLVEECEKAAANGCKYFYENEAGDSIHPFSLG